MKTAARSVLLIFAMPLLLAASTCDSSNNGVVDPCSGVEECDYEGEITCMSDTRYRECTADGDGCLVWDCST